MAAKRGTVYINEQPHGRERRATSLGKKESVMIAEAKVEALPSTKESPEKKVEN